MAYPHVLPELGYPYDALEPHIDARTMEIHHTKHHNAYTTNLNKALEAHPDLQKYSDERLLRELATLPESVRTVVRNNGGGFHNHNLFWRTIAPGGATSPGGSLKGELDSVFGSFDTFKEKLGAAATTRFGSGWGWLVLDATSKLAVTSTANQDSPLTDGAVPLFGIDVWEHAYYLKYQNRRPDYIAAIWNVINWDVVGSNYEAAKGR